MWLLCILFSVRVAAQPLALAGGATGLPSFDAWHSGVVPYPVLLATQLLILGAMVWTTRRISNGAIGPHRSIGLWLTIFGWSYLTLMAARLVLGLTLLSDQHWFARPLPTLFHLVLASYVLLVARVHLRQDAPAAASAPSDVAPAFRTLSWVVYPLTMAAAFTSFAWMVQRGVPLTASTYLPVVGVAALVTLLEAVLPHRRDWRPPQSEVRIDLAFMTIVQLAFPPLMGFLFTYALITPARALHLPTTVLWPHAWPLAAQAVLMVFAVDFLRYWLHRAAHANDTLWRLHSVHHSVERMYWLNTARFHVLEKALQMTLDSLPFLLMGVDARVLGAYYVAYATNGFFQHCNIELQYGPLNYLVGSAQTHRWHHSRLPRESNANYGNTVIVWDLVFGTWFLPNDRHVRTLGLEDPEYPKSFWGLMRAPFAR